MISRAVGIVLACLILGVMLCSLPSVENVEASSSYNRQAAYDYAEKYWEEVCSDGYFWDSASTYTSLSLGTNIAGQTGLDCAHFVSCAIGHEPHESGGGLDVPSRFPPTYGEPGAGRLGDWLLLSSGYAEKKSSVDELEKGDVINYDWNGDGNWDHVALYLGNGKVAAHTACVWEADWRLGGADSYRFIHIEDHEIEPVSDIVLVMDISGSMDYEWNGEEKLSSAKKAAEAFINSLSLGARVAVTTFADSARTSVHLASDFSVARVAIEELYAKGETNIGAALNKALDELEINSGTDNKKVIIFFTDGHITTGMGEDDVLAGPVNEAIAENIIIYAIGYGDPTYLCRDFLEEMAGSTGGAYYDATEAFQLQNVFVEAGQKAEGWEIEAVFAGTVGSQETVTAGTFDLASHPGSIKFILNWPGSDLDLEVFDPRGRELDYSASNVVYSGDVKPEYAVINDPLSGTWTLKVYGKTVPSATEYYLWVTTYTSPHTSSSFILFIALVTGIALVAVFLIWPRISWATASRRHISSAQKAKGEHKMAKKQTQITVPTITLSGKTTIVLGVVVALLLLVIGAATGTESIAYIGIFILPLTLFCGGLLLTDELTPIRVTLLVFAGLLLLVVASAAVTGATIFGMF